MVDFWKTKRLVIIGGAGFMGSRVVDRIAAASAEVFVPNTKDYNLADGSAVKRLFQDARPDLVINAAALVGRIGSNPGRFLYENLMMGAQRLEEAGHADVRTFVAIGTICAYPKFTSVPFKERYL
ncbi:MAG TPA: NAD-dependent epimerase/dehydratase family protein [Planctomycetota bacterium]|nr:NAD-dependent epimerase/dehydratase family protein [Planctomycetota bacterium]